MLLKRQMHFELCFMLSKFHFWNGVLYQVAIHGCRKMKTFFIKDCQGLTIKSLTTIVHLEEKLELNMDALGPLRDPGFLHRIFSDYFQHLDSKIIVSCTILTLDANLST